MRIALHVQSGPAAGRRIVFRAGQTASFGRTDWSDYAYPDDRTMADVHFELHFDGQGCLLRGLAEKAQTLVNGQVVEQAVLKHGDLILAGQSTFQVLMDNAAFETAIPLASAVALAATPDKVEDLPKLARQFGLSPEGIVVVKQCTLGNEVPDKLVQAELVIDAVRWQAHRLPKQQSVAWGCACAKGLPNLASLPEEQQAAIAAAEAWSVDPSEPNRLHAVDMLERCNVEGLGGALSAAAGWSGGSLAPEGQEVVTPDESLTGRAVFTALIIASASGGGSTTQRLKHFLQQVPAAPKQPR